MLNFLKSVYYKMRIYTFKDKFGLWFVKWFMPKRLVYWSTIWLGAKVTTGKYSNTIVPELNFVEAIQRYMDDNKL